jgi:hypothetical protein
MEKKLTKEVIEILGLANPWPLIDVLGKLIEATEILLHDKNYDRHGWEEMNHCVIRGKEIVSILQTNSIADELIGKEETEISDEDIEKEFPLTYFTGAVEVDDISAKHKRTGAKWLRDKYKGNH